jgi:hypothetical protein
VITHEYALAKAEDYLKNSEVPVKLTLDGEFPDGWFFCYQSMEYLDTGNPSAQLAGNVPFLVDRHSGELHVLGTAKPLAEYIDDYARKNAR